MSEYEQLQAVFTALGIPFEAMTNPGAIYQPYHCIKIEDIEFWFNSRGDFLQVLQSQYDDTLEIQRKDSTALWEDEIVAKNLECAQQADDLRQQAIAEERERRLSLLAQQRAEYRSSHPLHEATYATIVTRARAALASGDAPTFEQAVDKIAQEDPELLNLVLHAERRILPGDVPCSS